MGRAEREVVARGARLAEAAGQVAEDHERAVTAVREALRPLHEELVRQELERLPVARLRDVTEGRLRLDELEAGGFRTVQDVLGAGSYRLRQTPGVGRRTADQVVAAARQLAEAVEEYVGVRLDVDRPEPRGTALVVALHVLVEAGPQARRAAEAGRALADRMAPLLDGARPATGRWRMLLAGREARRRALAAVAELRTLVEEAEGDGVPERFAQASVDLLRRPENDLAAWVDFERRAADYYGLLADIADHGPDAAAAEGHLPDEVAGRVREQRLEDTHLLVSLRGYQSFGARFALAQRRVLLGDEMGLGKTVQAVAVLAHLAAEGQSHFMVVCPASVLINWTREIATRSTLRPVPLHGPGRQAAFADWKGGGGVAVTTFDALRGFPTPGGGELGMLVVDEAHYVKNPAALRTIAVRSWAERCAHVLFLTGTPMENRVAEFRNLVGILRPDFARLVGTEEAAHGSKAFRRAVAPVYLRRNQRDVLSELPALQHTDEWEEPSRADAQAYAEAVRSGNFMAMRRAAYARPQQSAKLGRLRELVREAAENGLKAVVFSAFREVLGAVAEALGEVHGPLGGGLPPERRQQIVDGFTAAPGHAVLLAQIEAGGIGLNLQVASVVILCEPQLKPTVERQAVARAHRMGQVRPVQVHRLLTTGGLDERLVERSQTKDRLFDAYARRSAVAESTPDAVDISDVTLARRIVAEEQARLGLAAEPADGAVEA
ncbi:DEAD/DEAH box helicase [Streptomyces griseosporeus]|uniref:DEAD/DEAH box helicase n=1 Tax=Streptomyces griseosporeus TaxID=1910 RepID=UPI00167D94AF|nr:DEAD/DEAH box helicase [Streptomyces griseosporeus]GHF63893.1 helicase SNF2 [Streptomyces griseosporeus]